MSGLEVITKQLENKMKDCFHGGVKMGDKNILLTYIKDGKQGFDWFDDITDMEISIIERGIKENEICDIIKINDCEDVELSFVCKNCMEGDKNDR